MNNPQKNNYIQYVNEFGKVQTRPVQFNDDGVNTTFVVEGIKENFFILGVYQNNIQVYGVGFDDIENNDMLAFLNSNIIDLDCIPNNAFLNAEQVVTMSYNNDYVKNFQKPVTAPDPEGGVNLTQKTNERLFFEEYLKEKYPLYEFVIKPISYQSSELQGSNRVVYYVKNGSFMTAGHNECEFIGASFLYQHDNFVLLTTAQSTNNEGQNFVGYRAFSNEPLWEIGGDVL
ncbi:hypothetical protein [Flavobacterium yafengii]|uniref:hypothetical protein n=1 Tax=Flavobacterium yafengii TaxID=3041253 RepID=UPI0024A89D67|nr:hypothetical protein [Flavobacterium yafengii]MDI5888741.1 hypothetical protein [Flavobacterium yafengii]